MKVAGAYSCFLKDVICQQESGLILPLAELQCPTPFEEVAEVQPRPTHPCLATASTACLPVGGCVVKTVLGSHFGVGEFTTHFRTYCRQDRDVHWGYGILTHGQLFDPEATQLFSIATGENLATRRAARAEHRHMRKRLRKWVEMCPDPLFLRSAVCGIRMARVLRIVAFPASPDMLSHYLTRNLGYSSLWWIKERYLEMRQDIEIATRSADASGQSPINKLQGASSLGSGKRRLFA